MERGFNFLYVDVFYSRLLKWTINALVIELIKSYDRHTENTVVKFQQDAAMILYVHPIRRFLHATFQNLQISVSPNGNKFLVHTLIYIFSSSDFCLTSAVNLISAPAFLTSGFSYSSLKFDV